MAIEITARKASVIKAIAEQLNRMLYALSGQGEVIDHNLEKGLGNEEAFRNLLIDFLPKRYGVAKGKIINSKGKTSRQLDVIIYDAINCPTLFVDENGNQVLPVEGVFGVIQVKTTLNATLLADAFRNLNSVYRLAPRVDRSTNNFVTGCPPFLEVFAFQDRRSLHSVAKQFSALNEMYPVSASCHSYSENSPGFKDCNGKHHLVLSVSVLNKGCVLQMLDGTVNTSDYGEYTLGMLLMSLMEHFDYLAIPRVEMYSYLNWIQVNVWRHGKQWLKQF